jgi:hypothetical protein
MKPKAGRTQRKVAAWHQFHKTGNYDSIRNDILLNWKSQSHERIVVQLLQHETDSKSFPQL